MRSGRAWRSSTWRGVIPALCPATAAASTWRGGERRNHTRGGVKMRTRYSTYSTRTDCYGNASLAWTIEGVCVLDIYHDPSWYNRQTGEWGLVVRDPEDGELHFVSQASARKVQPA